MSIANEGIGKRFLQREQNNHFLQREQNNHFLQREQNNYFLAIPKKRSPKNDPQKSDFQKAIPKHMICVKNR
jgi:hypothetical protein